MDLVIILILIAVVIFMFRNYHSVVYLLGSLEIFFRLIHYIGDHISFIKINPFVNKYIPTSLFNVISKHTSGPVEQIISWVLIIVFILLLIDLVKYLLNLK